jgi:hypothetical protein
MADVNRELQDYKETQATWIILILIFLAGLGLGYLLWGGK